MINDDVDDVVDVDVLFSLLANARMDAPSLFPLIVFSLNDGG